VPFKGASFFAFGFFVSVAIFLFRFMPYARALYTPKLSGQNLNPIRYNGLGDASSPW
jgi:hypothetical protein